MKVTSEQADRLARQSAAMMICNGVFPHISHGEIIADWGRAGLIHDIEGNKFVRAMWWVKRFFFVFWILVVSIGSILGWSAYFITEVDTWTAKKAYAEAMRANKSIDDFDKKLGLSRVAVEEEMKFVRDNAEKFDSKVIHPGAIK